MNGFNISIVALLDWVVDTLLPAYFAKLGSFFITSGVSVLGFSVAVTILCIVIGAILLRV